MEVLIGILLLIGAITPGEQYSQSQINKLETELQEEIAEVQSQSELVQQAEVLYQQNGPAVLVLDEPIL